MDQIKFCSQNLDFNAAPSGNLSGFAFLECHAIECNECTFNGNAADILTRGFRIIRSTGIVIDSCAIQENFGSVMDGVLLDSSFDCCILNSVIKDNSALDSSIGINLTETSSQCTVRRNILKRNRGNVTSIGIANNGFCNVSLENEAQDHDLNYDGTFGNNVTTFNAFTGNFLGTREIYDNISVSCFDVIIP